MKKPTIKTSDSTEKIQSTGSYCREIPSHSTYFENQGWCWNAFKLQHVSAVFTDLVQCLRLEIAMSQTTKKIFPRVANSAAKDISIRLRLFSLALARDSRS